MASRFIVSSSVRHPMRAAARAASHPAWPAPMTITSNKGMGLAITHGAARTNRRLQRPKRWPTMAPVQNEDPRRPGGTGGVRLLTSRPRPPREPGSHLEDRAQGRGPALLLRVRHGPRGAARLHGAL